MVKSVLAALPRSRRRARTRVVVLCYHSVHPTNAYSSATPRQFDQQIHWMTENCNVLSLRDALNHGVPPSDRWSKPTVVLTFDDGYDDNFIHALPVLIRHGVKASFYVTTGFIDRDPGVMDRMRLMRGMPVTGMSWEQILELRRAGMDVGSHTITHRNLVQLDDRAVQAELMDSKRALEDRLGEGVDSVAYPFGIPGHHVSVKTISLARDSGYRTGASILYRDVRRGDDLLSIPRIAVKNNSLRLLRAKILGSLDIIGRWQEHTVGRSFSVEGGGAAPVS